MRNSIKQRRLKKKGENMTLFIVGMVVGIILTIGAVAIWLEWKKMEHDYM